jgi:nucleotide-binding universal stress UspA family protein
VAIKTILVHLDEGPRVDARLELAVALARRHGARLVGAFAQLGGPHRVGIVAHWPSDALKAAAEASRQRFLAATDGLADALWEDVNRGSEPAILQAMVTHARHFDLVILGQHEQGHDLAPADLAEQVILESGRPVLVVPFAGHFAMVGQSPVLAWTDSAAAARALHDAIGLIAEDAKVLVVSVIRQEEADTHSVAQIKTQLACHGIDAETETLLLRDFGLMDLLLNRVADHGGDLLALGAFGGYGFPFLNRGAGTRFMLRHMTVPVLFSH